MRFSACSRHRTDDKAQILGPAFECCNAALLSLIHKALATRPHEVHHACELVGYGRVGARLVYAGAQPPIERAQRRVAVRQTHRCHFQGLVYPVY